MLSSRLVRFIRLSSTVLSIVAKTRLTNVTKESSHPNGKTWRSENDRPFASPFWICYNTTSTNNTGANMLEILTGLYYLFFYVLLPLIAISAIPVLGMMVIFNDIAEKNKSGQKMTAPFVKPIWICYNTTSTNNRAHHDLQRSFSRHHCFRSFLWSMAYALPCQLHWQNDETTSQQPNTNVTKVVTVQISTIVHALHVGRRLTGKHTAQTLATADVNKWRSENDRPI